MAEDLRTGSRMSSRSGGSEASSASFAIKVVHHLMPKTDLKATDVVGPLLPLPKRLAKEQPANWKTNLHLPGDVVMACGTSVSKCSPEVINLERKWLRSRNAKPGSAPPTLADTARSAAKTDVAGGASRTGSSDATAAPQVQGTEPEQESKRISTPVTAQSASPVTSPKRLIFHKDEIESPRMRKMMEVHPVITVNDTPPRRAVGLNVPTLKLRAYTTKPLPYGGDFLWIERDANYKHPKALTARGKLETSMIPKIQHPFSWSFDTVCRSRTRYAKAQGNPSSKMDDATNGLFDSDLISNRRLEVENIRNAKADGLEKEMLEGRERLEALKREEGFYGSQARRRSSGGSRHSQRRANKTRVAYKSNVTDQDEEAPPFSQD